MGLSCFTPFIISVKLYALNIKRMAVFAVAHGSFLLIYSFAIYKRRLSCGQFAVI